MDSKIKLVRIALQAFLIGLIISSCTANPNMHKIIAVWDYDTWEAEHIDGFELFVGYRNGDYNELIEINKTEREHEFRYEIEFGQNVHLALVAYYDIPVGKKKVRWRSPPAKVSLYPDPPENIKVTFQEWI